MFDLSYVPSWIVFQKEIDWVYQIICNLLTTGTPGTMYQTMLLNIINNIWHNFVTQKPH